MNPFIGNPQHGDRMLSVLFSVIEAAGSDSCGLRVSGTSFCGDICHADFRGEDDRAADHWRCSYSGRSHVRRISTL